MKQRSLNREVLQLLVVKVTQKVRISFVEILTKKWNRSYIYNYLLKEKLFSYYIRLFYSNKNEITIYFDLSKVGKNGKK